jgi:hypothetical protein
MLPPISGLSCHDKIHKRSAATIISSKSRPLPSLVLSMQTFGLLKSLAFAYPMRLFGTQSSALLLPMRILQTTAAHQKAHSL